MPMIFPLRTEPARHRAVQGKCAGCGTTVYENLGVLDDAYAVWWGRCSNCGAINGLDFSTGGRGYSSRGMDLVLPQNEEIIMNDLPPDTASRGWDDPDHEGLSKDELIEIYG